MKKPKFIIKSLVGQRPVQKRMRMGNMRSLATTMDILDRPNPVHLGKLTSSSASAFGPFPATEGRYSKECNKRNRKKRCTERVNFGSFFGCYTCPVACKSVGATRLPDHVRHWWCTCVGPCKGVLYCIRCCSFHVASTTLVLDSVLVWVRAENLRISRNVPWICVGRSGCCWHVLGSR